jgi:hypothetical protein
VGCKLVLPLWKSVQRFLKKLKMTPPYDPTIPPLGMYQKECKSIYKRDTCVLIFIAALFTTAKLWKQSRCQTTNERIKKIWQIYIPWTITQP